MSKKMTVAHKALYKSIDEILWNDWDPIGVNDIEEVRNEYQSYTDAIFSLKIRGSDRKTISDELYKIEAYTIGVLGNRKRCNQIADKIIDLKF
ncbi:MAG: hypothetical protein JSS76_01565 [Bacteroidetes bacterium]|nr:hypothetical protein [Bacteroidota bacterium]